MQPGPGRNWYPRGGGPAFVYSVGWRWVRLSLFLRPLLAAFCLDPAGGPAVWPAAVAVATVAVSPCKIILALVLPSVSCSVLSCSCLCLSLASYVHKALGYKFRDAYIGALGCGRTACSGWSHAARSCKFGCWPGQPLLGLSLRLWCLPG